MFSIRCAKALSFQGVGYHWVIDYHQSVDCHSNIDYHQSIDYLVELDDQMLEVVIRGRRSFAFSEIEKSDT